MTRLRFAGLLFGTVAIVSLSGCQQIEQAATEAVDKAKQTAIQTLDEARQAGSIEGAKQSAGNAVQEVKQQAAGLLQQASDYLSGNQQALDAERPGADMEPATEPKTDS